MDKERHMMEYCLTNNPTQVGCYDKARGWRDDACVDAVVSDERQRTGRTTAGS